jgi:Spy/CpxP family protein refolding chaperone
MNRSIAFGLLVALATAGLGMLSAPAWAADPAVIEELSLTGDQRAQMDGMFETYKSARKRAREANARQAFREALGQGDEDRARRELDSWAEGERARTQATGDLKIRVLSLLTEEQRKIRASAYPHLIQTNWTHRPSWEPPPRPKPTPQWKMPPENRPAN